MSRQEERVTTDRVASGGMTDTATRTETVSEVREGEAYRRPVTWEEMRTLMRESPERYYYRTWKPVTGGVLAIIAGIWNIIVGAGIIVGSLAINVVSPSFLWGFGDYAVSGFAAGVLLCALGVISVIGGSLAASRRSWSLGLIGGIAALVPSPVILPFFMGIFSVILVALGRREFAYRRESGDSIEHNEVEHNIVK
jgi:hypothetical protein